MEVKMVPIEGRMFRALVVNKNDEYQACENCGNPSYFHPNLAKKDKDWCLDCNDRVLYEEMNDVELSKWTLEQMDAGKIVIVVRKV